MINEFTITDKLHEISTDCLAILLFKDEELPEEFKELNEALGEQITHLLKSKEFGGEEGKSVILYASKKPFKRVLLIGGGEKEKASLETLRIFGGEAIRKARELKLNELTLHLRIIDSPEKSLAAVAEGALLANYGWGKKELNLIEKINIVSNKEVKDFESILKEVGIISEAVAIGRDLANGPANEINPETFEEKIKEIFQGLPVSIKVLRYEDLKKEGLNGIISVGKGSDIPPRLVIIEYRGNKENPAWHAVVGKGVCFDAGGLDLKSATSMLQMKFDKSGASYAAAIAYATAKLGLKINLVALLPLVENLPSGKSYKPLDIIKMYNGLTVEVHNTDAEGRLILADSLAYAEKNYHPETIIDLATLTGSIIVALGNQGAGLFTNNEDLKNKLLRVAEETGERVWPMPLWKEFYEDLKSDFADIKNLGIGRAGGAIAAAAFLSKFVEKTKWAHLDIAGTAWVQEEGPRKPYYPKGATGYSIRLVLKYLKDIAKLK